MAVFNNTVTFVLTGLPILSKARGTSLFTSSW